MFAYIQEFPVFFSEKAVLHPYIVNEVFAFKIVNKNLAHNTDVAFRAKCKMFSRHLQKPILKTEKGRFKGL